MTKTHKQDKILKNEKTSTFELEMETRKSPQDLHFSKEQTPNFSMSLDLLISTDNNGKTIREAAGLNP